MNIKQPKNFSVKIGSLFRKGVDRDWKSPYFSSKESARLSDFLTPVESLQAKPANSSLQWTGYLISALILTVLIWACISRTDIVVNASGRIVPSERTKVVASVETARVKSINISNGQHVRFGDVLIELDTSINDAEHNKAVADYMSAVLEKVEEDSILNALHNNRFEAPTQNSNAAFSQYGIEVSEKLKSISRARIKSSLADYKVKASLINSDIQRYLRLLPLAKRRANDLEKLANDHDIPMHSWFEQEQSYIEIQAQLDLANKKLKEFFADTEKQTLDKISDASRTMESLREIIRRTNAQHDMMILRAPVDGIVENVNIHTTGGVVGASEKLAEIVPENGGIEVEAMIDNKDVGFVKEGQSVALKIRSFEYSLYGTISGHVIHISRDAKADEQKELRYAALIKMDKADIFVDGGRRTLSPGMLVDAEIKTGHRRVIEYLLSPLIQYGHESIKER
jgi:hemolysin D